MALCTQYEYSIYDQVFPSGVRPGCPSPGAGCHTYSASQFVPKKLRPTMISVMHAQLDKIKKSKTNETNKNRLKKCRGNACLEEIGDDEQVVAHDGPKIEEDGALATVENLPLEQPSADSYADKWREFVHKLTDKDVGVFRSLQKLPNSIGSVFDKLELSTGLIFTPEERKLCYRQFTVKASSLGTILSSDMEEMLSQPTLDIVLPIQEIRHLMVREKQRQPTDLEGSDADPHSIERDGDAYDFQQFAAVVADARLLSKARARALSRCSASALLHTMLPIDPEASWKQMWDTFMLLLLLYCSFSVPYEIAFMETSPPELELFEILVPRPF